MKEETRVQNGRHEVHLQPGLHEADGSVQGLVWGSLCCFWTGGWRPPGGEQVPSRHCMLISLPTLNNITLEE